MGSSYATKGSSGGSAYARKGGGTATATVAKKKHHNFFGHLVGQTLTDLKDIGINLVPGLYHTGGALIHHPVGTAESIVKATAQDLRHPLRHPGYTLLDLAGVASVGAGTAVRIAGATGRAGEAARLSALVRPTIPERVFKVGEGEVRSKYARTSSTRLAQQAADKIHEKHPELLLPHRYATKVGKARTKQERMFQRMEDRTANELSALRKGLNKAQRFSIRVVGEKVPLAQRIADAEKQLAGATGKELKQQRAHLRVLVRTREYVHDVKNHDGVVVPRYKPNQDRLIHVYEKGRDLSNHRTRRLTEAELMSEAGAKTRANAPRQIVAEHLGIDASTLDELAGVDEPLYISYATGKTPRSLHKGAQVGSRNQIGVPRTPSELNHPLTGESLRSGKVHYDTPQTIAESSLRSNRFLSVVRQRQQFLRMAHEQPSSKYDIPIRPDVLKGKAWPQEVRDLLDGIDTTNVDEQGVRVKLSELRGKLTMTRQEFEALPAAEKAGVKWIDKRIVGSANRPGPLATLAQHPGPRVALRVVDAINNATKLALVQLKVGYAVPNIAGNLMALTTQQGVFAPFNLARQALLSHQIGRGALAGIDTLMGEGIARSLLGNVGVEAKLPEMVARLWNPVVDLPFRRAAFLHEAWRAGFKTSKDIERLLDDHALQPKLLEVADRANEAILDYSRLGPVEQDIIRRVIFLYPFVKATVLYSGHFLAEHPIQAALAAQIGAEEKARRQRELGDVPSWADALFKVGGTDSQPLVSNPAAISLLQTPAQLLETARRTFTGGGGAAYDLANQLNPALSAGLTALTKKDTFSGYDYGNQSPVKIFGEQLSGGIPARLLIERLRHGKYPTHTFPLGRREALLQFLLGTAAPRTANRAKLNAKAHAEQR